MTLILHLSPETEAHLQAAADAAGQDLNAYATAKLVEVSLREAEERDSAECVAAVEASILASDAGHTISLEEEMVRWEANKEKLIQQVRINQSAAK